MTQLPTWRRYLRFWGTRVDADVDDEIAFHIASRTDHYVARGWSEADARAEAIRRLGDLPQARDACLTIGHRRHRRMTRAHLIDALAQDARYALRTLARQPVWTAVAVGTFALGIGATTAVYSVVNALLLHPLAYRDADRVVMIWRVDPTASIMMTPSKKMSDAWQAQSRSFDAIERFSNQNVTLTGRGDVTVLNQAAIPTDFVRFTGIPMLAGRSFLPDEALPASPAVAIISERLWRQRFAGSASAIGSHLVLNDKVHTVVGVVPSRFQLPYLGRNYTDVFIPAAKDTMGFGGLTLARLRPGISPEAAGRELDTIVARNDLKPKSGGRELVAKVVRPADVFSYKTSLLMLAAAVALLLLVACANVAHLLLARGATRERELAIRSALGAGRGRLARQLLTESLILAVAGCTAGILVGFSGLRLLLAARPEAMEQLDMARLDGRTLLVAITVSVITGVAFGLTAAVHAIRRTTSDSLRATSSGASGGQSHRVRSVLVASEMALSAMLLVGASLLVRSVIKLQRVDPGFTTTGLYSAQFALPSSRYATAARAPFFDDVMRRVRAIPGVTGAALADATPPGLGGFLTTPLAPPGSGLKLPAFTAINRVAPDYFQLLGIRLIEGHSFTAGSSKRNEIILNEGVAKKLWPGQTAIGRVIAGEPSEKNASGLTVIGVAANVSMLGLSHDPGEPFVYESLEPSNEYAREVVAVRMTGKDVGAFATALRSIVESIDPQLPPPEIKSVDAALSDSMGELRFTMTLLAVFASLAVVLSAVGLYGVIAYVVAQRTREIGIRVALGASPVLVARTIVSRGLVLSITGLIVGLAVARWGTKLIESVLYGVTPADAASYVATAVLLLAISLIACALPMRRAMAVDPVIAMRGE
jgi:putative ABC transport system permease protein